MTSTQKHTTLTFIDAQSMYTKTKRRTQLHTYIYTNSLSRIYAQVHTIHTFIHTLINTPHTYTLRHITSIHDYTHSFLQIHNTHAGNALIIIL